MPPDGDTDGRLAAGVLASALIRRVNAAGGNAVVVARGDPTAGAVLLICAERGIVTTLRERVLGVEGCYAWQAVGPADLKAHDTVAHYVERRRSRDPDLWVIELDIADAERFAAETTGDH